jgi:hypothetical protein
VKGREKKKIAYITVVLVVLYFGAYQ